MKCIIGLGNIGKEYEHTRHNMGFMCIDNLAKKYNVVLDKKLKKCIYGDANIEGEKVIFAKPVTYMNLSGEAVVELLNWFKLNICDICIIYDDVDLPFGVIRYRVKGSGGTHNGMKNVIEKTGNESITRIRVGIESGSEEQQRNLVDFVLGKFSKEEMKQIEEVYFKVEENVQSFLTK